ncbi:acyl-CoA dehydratase activase [Berryella wangjianweii]|nr:acyl-CoA dehydratase activase [Berryella wangjianweii]
MKSSRNRTQDSQPTLRTASIGIDIGSTATKVALMADGELLDTFLMPTGFSSVDASDRVAREVVARGFSLEGSTVVATGYGRVAVPYAHKAVTEITCHGLGAWHLFGTDGTVIDVGGQDTKIIQVAGGKVRKFVMNNKCASGTGKFLELMADRMGVSQSTLSELAKAGDPTPITSVCTVFADSEVVSLIGRGEPLENIANGIVESVVSRVSALVGQLRSAEYFLTGGLCDNAYVVERLSAHLGAPVHTVEHARYAGAIGAALSAGDGAAAEA